MQIASFQNLTLLDYPGHLAALIFTPGCNFRCPFCHNPELVDPEKIKKLKFIPEKEVMEILTKRKKLLEGVVITGGEPTLQTDLMDFIKKIKALGYLVKLDTNGSHPQIIEKLLQQKLIDFIAMDIKGPLNKYDLIVNKKINQQQIKKSIELIINSKIDYEFRTTVLPEFHQEKDIKAIGELIKGAKVCYLQRFEPKITLNPSFKRQETYTQPQLKTLAKIISKYVPKVETRGIF